MATSTRRAKEEAKRVELPASLPKEQHLSILRRLVHGRLYVLRLLIQGGDNGRIVDTFKYFIGADKCSSSVPHAKYSREDIQHWLRAPALGLR